MKRLLLAALLTLAIPASVAWGASFSSDLSVTVTRAGTGTASDLAVASNGHYLNKGGVPFFFLSDTEWILNLRSDSDVATILSDRAAKGFSVVQVMAVRSWSVNGSGVSHDANGNLPFNGNDPTQLNQPYWARWHSIANQAAAQGLHFLMVYGEPGISGSNWNCITGATCYEYGRQVGALFRDLSNVIFCDGQDSHASSNTDLYLAIAEGVADGVNGVNNFNGQADYSTTMMTYHGQNDQVNTFQQAAFLDFYGTEVYGWIAGLYNEVNSTYNLTSPTKPSTILEGDYETFTYPDGFATPYRERLQVWNVFFAGGAGYAYGHNSNYIPSEAPSSYLSSAGAQGMQVFSTFMRARSWWKLAPHQASIMSAAGSGETQKSAVQSVDGSECLVYYPDVEAVTISMGCITSSNTVNASWFDPRNGNTQTIGSFANSGSQSLTPPSGWEDAVLVLTAS